MNKKMILPLMLILGISLVAAISYYALFSTSFTVLPAITITGEVDQNLGEVHSGGLVEGEEIVISNDAPTKRTLTLEAETECDIETSYASVVDMNKKNSTWDIIPSTTVVLSYVVIGDEFKYKVDTELEDYVVVYYPDIDGNPGAWNIENATLIGDANMDWTSSDIGYLPEEVDWNDKAKLWLIPAEDWDNKAWNPTEWYFENNLITYDETVTLDSEESMIITPLYEIGVGESGVCTVTTTVA